MARSRKRRRGLGDSHAARELRLFIDNDSSLYRQRFMPILQNQCKKRKKGVYDPTKSVKGWRHLVNDGARKYAREFGHKFDTKTKQAVAGEYARETANTCSEYGLGRLRRRRRRAY